MKVSTTSERLHQLMDERGMRQADVLRAAEPYCRQLDVKLGRNDLSQYLSGKVEPGQFKLTVLGLTFDVNESWLMGLDVPRERDIHLVVSSKDPQINEIIETARLLNAQGLERLSQYADDLARIPSYQKKKSPTPISAGASRRVAARGGVVVDQDHPADDDAFLKAIAESEPPETV